MIWKPIESAPTDGRFIWVMCPDGQVARRVRWGYTKLSPNKLQAWVTAKGCAITHLPILWAEDDRQVAP